jgi:hypothetical protein
VSDVLEQLLRSILDEKLNPIQEKLQKLDKIEKDVEEIKAVVSRIEADQPKDISTMLQLINRKLDMHNIDLEYLKGKTGKHDADINRINRMMES